MRITFLKLFLTTNSSYLTYFFQHFVDTIYSSGLSFIAPLCDCLKRLFVSCVRKSELGVRNTN